MSFCITGLVMVEFVIEMANQLQRLIFSTLHVGEIDNILGSANSVTTVVRPK